MFVCLLQNHVGQGTLTKIRILSDTTTGPWDYVGPGPTHKRGKSSGRRGCGTVPQGSTRDLVCPEEGFTAEEKKKTFRVGVGDGIPSSLSGFRSPHPPFVLTPALGPCGRTGTVSGFRLS